VLVNATQSHMPLHQIVYGLRTHELVGMQMAWRDDGHHIH